MSVYRITTHGEGLFYVRICTETANAKGIRPECITCIKNSHSGGCEIMGRFMWKDYGGKEGALEAAKAFIRELKQKRTV